VPNKPRARILELSAGSGKHLSIPFAKKGHVVTASEYAAKACKNIDRIVAMHDVQIEILEIDFRNLLIPNKRYNYIFARYCLQNHMSLRHLESTLLSLQGRTMRGGEHRFLILTNQRIIKPDRKITKVQSIARYSARAFTDLLMRTYCSWNISLSAVKDCDGVCYKLDKSLPTIYDALFFSAKNTM